MVNPEGHEGMWVNYKAVESQAVDIRPEDCVSRKFVEANSLQAIKSAFRNCECLLWQEDCWEFADDAIAPLIVDSSRLKVISKPSESLCLCPERRGPAFLHALLLVVEARRCCMQVHKHQALRPAVVYKEHKGMLACCSHISAFHATAEESTGCLHLWS